jgi:type I restriction enzyme, R subunit
LVTYPRAGRTFYQATEHQDAVDSRLVIRDALGREQKPEDYLAAFARFVQQNPSRVQAIRILLGRPKGWGTGALAELRKKLASTPERFTEESLQKAHEAHYHKALVDIISMVKHAAREQEPLLTARERVERALWKLTADRHFSTEQQQWLGRIREHLVANLSIDEEDFDTIPVLSQAGGWGKADGVFDGKLGRLVGTINEVIAA